MARQVTEEEYALPPEVQRDQGTGGGLPDESDLESAGEDDESYDEPVFRSSLADAAATYESMSDDQLRELQGGVPMPSSRRAAPQGEAANSEVFRRTCIDLSRSHLETVEGSGRSRPSRKAEPRPTSRRRVAEDRGALRDDDRGDWSVEDTYDAGADDGVPADPLEAAIYYAGLVADYQEQARELLELAAEAQAQQAECLLEIARQEG